MIRKCTTPDGELYVYMNGMLLYKKYANGASVLFEKYGMPTRNTDRDEGHY